MAISKLSTEANTEYSSLKDNWSPSPVNVGSAPRPSLCLAEANVMVLLPTSKRPDACKATGIPEIVTPGPPAEMVVPSMENAVGFAVKTCPATVNTDAEAPGASKDPGTTMPDAPGVSVWLPIMYAPASLAVKV